MKINGFIHQYPLSKTLRFKLIPYGRTLEHFTTNISLQKDEELARLYQRVKGYIDEYHRHFINEVLSSVAALDVSAYASLYYKASKDPNDKKKLENEGNALRKKIATHFSSHKNYKTLFDKDLICNILPAWVEDEEKKREIEHFHQFTTYFVGFYENRKNFYTEEAKATGIANRCINDNLPKFLDNARSYEKLTQNFSAGDLSALLADVSGLTPTPIEEFFSLDGYKNFLSQNGIESYNHIIGAVNSHVNQFNQTHGKSEFVPKFKVLFKQILCEGKHFFAIPEAFTSDNEVLGAVNDHYTTVISSIERLNDLFCGIEGYNSSGIYLRNNTAVSELSYRITGSWHSIKDAWEKEYDNSIPNKKKRNDTFYENQEKTWKNISAFSLSALQGYTGDQTLPITDYLKKRSGILFGYILDCYRKAEDLIGKPYTNKSKRLAKNDDDIALIKNLLDALKAFELFAKPFSVSADAGDKDDRFYAVFDECYNDLSDLDRLYDKVRNYITQKPYSTDKIKLNFDNSQFLNGWDKNKEKDYRNVLLRKGNDYYLGIMAKDSSRLFLTYPNEDSNGWEKIEYKYISKPFMDLPKNAFSEKYRELMNPSKEILDIRSEKTYIKDNNNISNFSLSDCHKMIEYYQNFIALYPNWVEFNLHFKSPHEYNDINEFFTDVADQGYKLSFNPISEAFIEDHVASGELYLFRIYSKDFSENSKGTPNLHTLYFKMLFDERNLNDVVIQLCGGAEMFYRYPSIKPEELIVHHKGEPIKNKNSHNTKEFSTFEYDIIKDRRYSQPQFSLHIPIKLNYKSTGKDRINAAVRKALKASDKNYVIGIDRGERHLIYVTVVDNDGNIVEQFSGNCITNEYNDCVHTTDYRELLDRKEKERLSARQNWTTIEGIKELKEGYGSQIVHKICQLVVKYDAIIAMEDLNSGFKNSRAKVEKQMYQKFEKMLIDKLNYLADKNKPVLENGGILKAYQLTEKFESFKKIHSQNGFIFYVPAWLTSKIDPTTGFVDLLNPRYTSVEDGKAFIRKFDSIVYNPSEKLFEFSFDYRNFPKGSTDFTGKWTVCSYGKRIETRRDPEANNRFISSEMDITHEWESFFKKWDIAVSENDMKEQILMHDKKDFYVGFMHLLKLTLQMRNSIPGTETDYLISPVRNRNGEFYNSTNYSSTSPLPSNADANGAYNIARKAMWMISKIKNTPDSDLKKACPPITNKEWLEFAQTV
ncbi:MAG: type V CRISPR-associated protein Cpf1 [Ruminococcaceae bacterium]|nr:type V CRISPR-associated protein Cpf1 [Oscillospiraceae bacterium]